jgi:tryptophan 7-halogenase
MGPVRRVVVVGGGTAGYFAALALKRELPHLDVTLVESSKIPMISVGEATTTLMPPFLHQQLGIDIVDLYRAIRPTWKLGIKFDWGLPGDYSFNFPFGASSLGEAYAHDGTIENQSVSAMMMTADRAPIVTGDDGQPRSLLPELKFAYHLDNKPFVAYLAKHARGAGIHHVDAVVKDAISADGETIDRLILEDGSGLCADLYVDATGFRALLIEKILGSPFTSFGSSLFCDSAVVASVPQNGTIQPYTTAETMDAGWCWRIPVEGEDHRGYVYSSAHLTPDAAQAEMRAKNPGLGEPWSIRFRSGRHREFWKGNTVAIGNSYGFVEPLESTTLHMVIIEVAYLIGGLRTAGDGREYRAFANQALGGHWDDLRWFLTIHYKFNRKKDTTFWRDCRETADVSGVAPLLERFSRVGPWDFAGNDFLTSDPTFVPGVLTLLLGQQVPCPRPTGTSLAKTAWDTRVAESRALVRRAFTQAEALDLLRLRPDLLQELVASEDSWVNCGGERITGVDPVRGLLHPKREGRQKRGPYTHLLEGVNPPQPARPSRQDAR